MELGEAIMVRKTNPETQMKNRTEEGEEISKQRKIHFEMNTSDEPHVVEATIWILRGPATDSFQQPHSTCLSFSGVISSSLVLPSLAFI